tara:strand:- start:3174 stop:4280 length:1107 start_codon:yes stop_codon:yes gene_type:complete
MNKKNILYVFISGRKEKLSLSDRDYAKEFFYGYQYFKNTEHNVDIIEFKEKDSIFNFIYYLMNKLSDLPLYGQYLINKKNYKKLKDTDEIIFTNQKTAFSMLPMLILVKIRKKINSHVFVMGLFGKTMKYKIKHLFREMFIKLLLISSKNLIFLGLGEYELAIEKYSKYKNKFVFLPFGIDTNFWRYSEEKTENNNVLFIGNDGMRDYEFLEELILKMPNYTFNVVSNQFNISQSVKNLNLYKGDWAKNTYDDEFIYNLYKKCNLTIIPIKKTYQPSGQSVTLQSMSVGTPVLITKTKGFWDKNNFIDSENIYFIKENNIDEWKKNIENYIGNKSSNSQIGLNASQLINNKYNLDIFNKKLDQIIFNN